MTYRYLLRNGGSVGYYIDEVPAGTEENYMTATVPAGEESLAGALRGQGFYFVERSMLLEIPLRDLRAPVKLGRKYSLYVDRDWNSEEIFSIAKSCFGADFRFAVAGPQSGIELKNEILFAFLRELKEQKFYATRLYSENGLEGFNIWKVKDSGGGRVYLGAMSERCQSTGVALPLYFYTVEAMREQGVQTLEDIVSSTNMAALNLHATLIRFAGGTFHFGGCRDCYLKVQPEKREHKKDKI